MERNPQPLQDSCVLYLLTRVDDFPPHELAMLPRHLRSTLLHVAPPVLLYYLEQTPVASQINTETIWKEIGEQCQAEGVWPLYSSLHAESYEYRDCLITSIWDQLLGGKWRNTSPKNPSLLDDWRMGFTIRSSNSEFNHCLADSEIEAVSYMLTFGALPKVLEVLTTHVSLCQLWRNKPLLQQFLQLCRPLRVKLWGGISIEFVLKGLAQSPQPKLQELELYFTPSAVLSAIARLFTQQNGFSLKKLFINLSNDAKVNESREVFSPLVLIIRSQRELQTLALAQMENCNSINDKISSKVAPILAGLLQRPKFQNLRLISLKYLPLHVVLTIIEGFVLSQPEDELHLSFESVGIFHYKVNSQDSRQPPSVDPKEAKLTGPKKYLYFRNMVIPRALVEWLCSMQYIYLNTLYFHTHEQHASKIRKCFQSHQNFHVQNFEFSEFSSARVPPAGW